MGLLPEEASGVAGVAQAVGARWFRDAGGMPPFDIKSQPSGRYLCFAEREEIALLRAQGKGVREIARAVGRDPGTISRELRRNAATRSGEIEYRASVAQWKSDMAARHGDTENKILVTAMLADLVDRGLDHCGGLLVVIDGAKALAAAVRQVFGDLAVVARCQIHKQRNVEGHLPDKERSRVRRRLGEAFTQPDPDQGLANARRLAAELDKTYPDAAGSIREGLEEMFTVRRLGVTGTLLRTLKSTNPIESMISIARTTTGNVKRWRDGEMRRRWCAAGMIESEKSFRRVRGYRQMPALVAQLRAHAAAVTAPCDTEQDSIAA